MAPLMSVTPRPAISVEEAAARLGVEPRFVRDYVRQHLLRPADDNQRTVLEADVTRLHRVLRRCEAPSRESPRPQLRPVSTGNRSTA
jgi:hypothetical protein